MKPTCPNCRSENLDQGIDGMILCHDCKKMWNLVASWILGKKREK